MGTKRLTNDKKETSFVIAFLTIAALFIGCINNKNEYISNKTVSIVSLTKLNVDDKDYTGVKLIKSYFYKGPCYETNNTYNLFVCTSTILNDTLLIFEPCERLSDFEKNVSEYKNNLCILHKDVETNHPLLVTVSVPDNFKFPVNSKYVFSSLSLLED